MFNMLVVFTFVALWHDIQLKLLIWGWLVTLFVLPEVLAGYVFPKRKWQGHEDAYRMICGIGAVGNILMMMAANLVGFAVTALGTVFENSVFVEDTGTHWLKSLNT